MKSREFTHSFYDFTNHLMKGLKPHSQLSRSWNPRLMGRSTRRIQTNSDARFSVISEIASPGLNPAYSTISSKVSCWELGLQMQLTKVHIDKLQSETGRKPNGFDDIMTTSCQRHDIAMYKVSNHFNAPALTSQVVIYISYQRVTKLHDSSSLERGNLHRTKKLLNIFIFFCVFSLKSHVIR